MSPWCGLDKCLLERVPCLYNSHRVNRTSLTLNSLGLLPSPACWVVDYLRRQCCRWKSCIMKCLKAIDEACRRIISASYTLFARPSWILQMLLRKGFYIYWHCNYSTYVIVFDDRCWCHLTLLSTNLLNSANLLGSMVFLTNLWWHWFSGSLLKNG